MKRIISAVACLVFFAGISFAQNKKDIITEKTIVKGTCGQCKNRIEDAAYINGVKRAEWDKNTKELTVTYRPSKTSLQEIEKRIAAAGHDAGSAKASDSAYNQLPECCAYKHDHASDH